MLCNDFFIKKLLKNMGSFIQIVSSFNINSSVCLYIKKNDKLNSVTHGNTKRNPIIHQLILPRSLH